MRTQGVADELCSKVGGSSGGMQIDIPSAVAQAPSSSPPGPPLVQQDYMLEVEVEVEVQMEVEDSDMSEEYQDGSRTASLAADRRHALEQQRWQAVRCMLWARDEDRIKQAGG